MPKDPYAAWKSRQRAWLRFANANVRAMEAGKAIPSGPSARALVAPPVEPPAGQRLKVVVCSPHPDDEALVGALPLRMRLELGAAVTDCAITFGSKLDQRPRRLRELEASCRALGFDLVAAQPPLGFDHVGLENRQNHPDEWAAKVEVLSNVFEQEKPDVVFAPHAQDFNSTHIGTHYLATDALAAYLERTGRGPLPFIETEFWHENPRPNLMVGVTPEVEAILLMAVAEHGEEVSRNPYHLRHPGWMIDNVRLGAEVVGGQGGPAPTFPFAGLYHFAFMVGKELVGPCPGGRIIAPEEKIDLKALADSFWPEGR